MDQKCRDLYESVNTSVILKQMTMNQQMIVESSIGVRKNYIAFNTFYSVFV